MDHGLFFHDIFSLFYGGLLGLLSASLAAHFGCRSADRLPGESRMPTCVFCMRPLQLHEYFPLFGWLLRPHALSLPCPCGKKKGLWAQPAVELTGFVFGALVILFLGWSNIAIPVCLAIGLLPAIAFIDLAFGLIPDELNITLGLLGLINLVIGHGDIYAGLISVAVLLGIGLFFALTYSRWRGQEMLGLGDVKFFAAAGFWLPIAMVPWFLGIAGFMGIILGVLWKYFLGDKEFPFAPALCLTLAGCIYYQVYLFSFN